jgi:hypothetical protein
MHVHTAVVGGGDRDTYCTSKMQFYRRLLMVLFLLYDVETSYVHVNARIPE